MDRPTPLSVIFKTVHTRIPVPITIINDEIEEVIESFTLELSYDDQDDGQFVRLINASTTIYIEDDDG